MAGSEGNELTDMNSSVLSTSNQSSSPFAESPVAFSPVINSLSSQDEEEPGENSGCESGNEEEEENYFQNGDQENMFVMDNEDEVSNNHNIYCF